MPATAATTEPSALVLSRLEAMPVMAKLVVEALVVEADVEYRLVAVSAVVEA